MSAVKAVKTTVSVSHEKGSYEKPDSSCYGFRYVRALSVVI